MIPARTMKAILKTALGATSAMSEPIAMPMMTPGVHCRTTSVSTAPVARCAI
jgi:hypothetical protein